jgi:NADPH:quinone reductase-like Zn-dependent oxidoreductase
MRMIRCCVLFSSSLIIYPEERMQAIRVREFGGPEVMKVEEGPDLLAGDDQIVVQIQAAGVNPVDIGILSGTHSLMKPNLPYTRGWDAAGTVSSIGSGLHHVQVGDRVYVAGTLTGCYASQALCTAGSDRGKILIAEQGAHHVVNHHDADSAQQIMNSTKGKGVNVILEMLANVNLDKDLRMLANGGRIVLIGNRGTIEINPGDAMRRHAAILGLIFLLASPEEIAGSHAGLSAGLENGFLNPVVGQEFPLADAPRAHVALMEPGAYGKIVLRP